METLSKEFVPYQESLALKELGLDVKSSAFYNPNGVLFYKWKEVEENEEAISLVEIIKYYDDVIKDRVDIPTFSQAFRWFREKYNLFGCIDLQVCTPAHWYIRIDNIIKNYYIYHSEDEDLKFNTYEEAELACLRKLIEIVKNEHR